MRPNVVVGKNDAITNRGDDDDDDHIRRRKK
jgi:hypothetical protein